jgi:serine/threonine protein phosphatase PrpC
MRSIGTEISGVAASPDLHGLIDGRDFAGRQIQGARESQEDSYGVMPHSEFSKSPNDLFFVVADGMGGHAAGEVASSLAVSTFAETFLVSGTACDAGRLWDCLEQANSRIAQELVAGGDDVQGMGTTLLAVLLRGKTVRWISVGDSPLYLWRDNNLKILNRLHSKATELAELVSTGEITEEEARNDPGRHVLISALVGESISDVDDSAPLELQNGDVLIAATDGIETLSHNEIADIVAGNLVNDATTIVDAILDAINSKQSPKQDNATVVVVRINE